MYRAPLAIAVPTLHFTDQISVKAPGIRIRIRVEFLEESPGASETWKWRKSPYEYTGECGAALFGSAF